MAKFRPVALGEKMSSNIVAFVAFQEQPNLGIGYLSSVLMDAGYSVEVIDFQLGRERVLQELQRARPLLVGFSIIFQYHLERFGDLIGYLRENGVGGHFTAGGHYPSLRPAEIFEFVPDLDSIVLFEGEHTCLELVETLAAGGDWRQIRGIARLEDGSVTQNSLRPLERDLDRFPPPLRPPLREFVLGKKHATLVAGRGCVYDCSFCSIRRFYSAPPGPVKRLRSPDLVAREMELLREEMDCSIFMFQDDDFPVARPHGKQWALEFCRHLREKGLTDKILWKVNCRPDEVDPALFSEMQDCGLFLVYLGIESGTDEGLRLMNKRVNVARVLRGVDTLKELGIHFDYGFMLFDPSSTCESIRRNLDFLEQIVGDGSAPVTFCKMRPYAETRIEAELRKQGRLIGPRGREDYEFLDDAVNELYSVLLHSFDEWIGKRDGVLNLAKWVRYYLSAFGRFAQSDGQLASLEARARAVVAESNEFALDQVREACDWLETGGASFELFRRAQRATQGAHAGFQKQLKDLIRDVKLARAA